MALLHSQMRCHMINPDQTAHTSCTHNHFIIRQTGRSQKYCKNTVNVFKLKSLTPIFIHNYTPPHKKWRGIMLYPPNFECPSVCLSISTSFPCSNFSTFWPIFFKLCIDIDIGEEWYRIASGLISFWNNIVIALDVCQKCVFGQYLKNE